jgi:L-asparagine transporter-like permease
MIAIGGVIGAGLFVGSGTAISAAGPAVLLAYIGVGAVVFLIMRMLAELAVASPDSGSFATYATRAFGPWAGGTVSSLYTYSWVVVIGFEATAGAAIVHGFFPAVAPWAAALVFMLVFTLTNLVSARAFGQFEFWFALIKVVAICAFLVIGALAIAGALPGTDAPGLSNLTGHGFAPHGWQPVWLACLVGGCRRHPHSFRLQGHRGRPLRCRTRAARCPARDSNRRRHRPDRGAVAAQLRYVLLLPHDVRCRAAW